MEPINGSFEVVRHNVEGKTYLTVRLIYHASWAIGDKDRNEEDIITLLKQGVIEQIKLDIEE
jgi:hypothetical protein